MVKTVQYVPDGPGTEGGQGRRTARRAAASSSRAVGDRAAHRPQHAGTVTGRPRRRGHPTRPRNMTRGLRRLRTTLRPRSGNSAHRQPVRFNSAEPSQHRPTGFHFLTSRTPPETQRRWLPAAYERGRRRFWPPARRLHHRAQPVTGLPPRRTRTITTSTARTASTARTQRRRGPARCLYRGLLVPAFQGLLAPTTVRHRASSGPAYRRPPARTVRRRLG
jgi:hypothetical protein